jgi:3-oxoacyl-[acyl-carrier-protein] synthase-3
MTQRYARITGMGKYVPARRLTNYDLEQMVDTSDEWITSHTGIRERRVAAPDETAVSMALEASRVALANAGMEPEDLDMVILATSSPDYFVPASASILQDRLGARNASAFDLVSGCTGWVYGMVTATQFIQTGSLDRILVVASEVVSRGIDYTDRNTAILFGDGAAAAVLEPSLSPTGVLAFELGSDGSGWDALYCPGGGSANPFSQAVLDKRENYLHMDGKRVLKFATRTLSGTIQRVVQRSGLPFEEIDCIVPHQTNQKLIDLMVKRLKVDPNKVMVNLDRYGNTSAVAVGLAMTEAVEQGKVKEGNHVVVASFGAGLTWASAVIHWQPTKPESEQAILVSDWPVRERLQLQANKMRASLWSAQVTARTKAQEASMSVMVPFYTWQRKRRKAKEQKTEDKQS